MPAHPTRNTQGSKSRNCAIPTSFMGVEVPDRARVKAKGRDKLTRREDTPPSVIEVIAWKMDVNDPVDTPGVGGQPGQPTLTPVEAAPVDVTSPNKKDIKSIKDHLHHLEIDLCVLKEQSVMIQNRVDATNTAHLTKFKHFGLDLAKVVKDIKECNESLAVSSRLRDEFHELEDGVQEHITKLEECLNGVKKLHEGLVDIKQAVMAMREIINLEESARHQCPTADNQDLQFKWELLLDNHNILRHQFDCLARMIMNSSNMVPPWIAEQRTAEVTSASVKHWLSHLMDAGKAAIPEAFSAKTLELAQYRIDRCAGPSAAVAALLWSTLDFLTIAWEMTGAKGCLPSTSTSTTLRLYNTLQPVVRHAIITLAHAPGGWAFDSQSQILATNDLTSFLNKLVLSSGIKELSIALGEPFLGFAKNTHNRWLPTLSYGSQYSR